MNDWKNMRTTERWLYGSALCSAIFAVLGAGGLVVLADFNTGETPVIVFIPLASAALFGVVSVFSIGWIVFSGDA